MIEMCKYHLYYESYHQVHLYYELYTIIKSFSLMKWMFLNDCLYVTLENYYMELSIY